MQERAESYQAVLPQATDFSYDEAVNAAVAELAGTVYDQSSFGRTYVNEAVFAQDESGQDVGCVILVTTADGYDGEISLSVGIDPAGTVTGIAFTELEETPGMGMRVDENEFKDQFAGKSTDAFILNTAGTGSADNEINSVSGASTTSGAVVNAVNTALAFYREHIA